MNSKLVCILLAVVGCAAVVSVSADEADHKVVVAEPIVDPYVDIMIDDTHVKATYYDKTIKGSDYTDARRKFDSSLMDALVEFGYGFANDVVVKNSYIITIGPKYMAKLTSLVAKFLPEFSRQVAAGGPDVKDGFIGDAINIWTSITKSWLVDPALKAKIKPEVPKDAQDFMKKFRQFLDICQITVKRNPVGIYLDWNNIQADGKTVAEMGAPFVVYLQENGYKRAIGIMDSLMGVVAKIKPGSSKIPDAA